MWLRKVTAPNSSPVDWCEWNYAVSDHVAEFANSITGLFIIYLGYLMLKWNKRALKVFPPQTRYISVLILLVGVFTVYFHASLSILGQMLDEIGILWVQAGCWYFMFPQSWVIGQKNYFAFRKAVLLSTAFSTSALFYYPKANAFVLLGGSVPLIAWCMLGSQLDKTHEVGKVTRKALVVFLMAVVTWMFDKFACDMTLHMNAPYFHAVWHVLSALACVSSVTSVMLIKLKADYPHIDAQVRTYPNVRWLGVDYIHIKDSNRT